MFHQKEFHHFLDAHLFHTFDPQQNRFSLQRLFPLILIEHALKTSHETLVKLWDQLQLKSHLLIYKDLETHVSCFVAILQQHQKFQHLLDQHQLRLLLMPLLVYAQLQLLHTFPITAF